MRLRARRRLAGRRRREGRGSHVRVSLGDARHHQEIRRRPGDRKHRPEGSSRRMRRSVRRERRRQVDADESAVGGVALRHLDRNRSLGRPRTQGPGHQGNRGGRNRHHPSGIDVGAAPVGRGKYLPRIGADHVRRVHGLRPDERPRCRADGASEDARHQRRASGVGLFGRQAAVDRDRQGDKQERQTAHSRRTDLGADRHRDAHAARPHPGVPVARHGLRLYLPQGGRDRRDRRHGDRPPRRHAYRHHADVRAEHRTRSSP